MLPAAFGIGLLIGGVGIGGILLIPALSAFAGLTVHQAMATALFTFLFTGVAGSVMFQRRGSIEWRITVPLCAGAVVFAFLGAWLNSLTAPAILTALLSGLIIFAGVHTLAARRGAGEPALFRHGGLQRAMLFAIGAVSGFGSGLTGVGGPAISVPLMVLCGFPALASIGASQVIQIIAAGSGTLGNLKYGAIAFHVAVPVTLLEIAGVALGARIVHAIDIRLVRGFTALLCVAAGVFLLARVVVTF